MDVFEIQFPDLTVARYPRGRVKELITSQRVEQHWPARLKGDAEWFTVAYLIETTGDLASSVPKPPATMSDGTEDGPSFPSAEAAQTEVTPSIKGSPAVNTSLENHETVIASIGQRSLVGFLKGEGLAMTNVILTDQRIYGRGRIIDRSVSAEAWVVGDVSAISAASLLKTSDWKKLAFGICLLFCALVILQFSQWIGAFVFIVGTFFVTLYFLTRRKVLQINLSGQAYNFAIGGVDDETILSFMEQAILFLANRNKL